MNVLECAAAMGPTHKGEGAREQGQSCKTVEQSPDSHGTNNENCSHQRNGE